MPGAYLWGWDAPVWRRVIVDGTGHLQVDVLAAPATVTHCYGWDGDEWLPMLFEADDVQNLRVKLYDGANGIDSSLLSAVTVPDATRGLVTRSALMLSEAGSDRWNEWETAREAADGDAGSGIAPVALWGWNGGSFDRLRVDAAYRLLTNSMLYDGANAIDSALGSTIALADALRGLVSNSLLRLSEGGSATWNEWRTASDVVDASDGANMAPVGLYGYNGTTWDRLRMESAAAHNLRARLYGGANAVEVSIIGDMPTGASYGLFVKSLMIGYDFALGLYRSPEITTTADNLPNRRALYVNAYLMGYDGSTWDRLRTYGTGILKVGRAEVGLLDIRLTATGPVGAAGTRRLYWMLLNPSAGNSAVELTDAIAAGAAVKADHFDTSRDGHMITFDPPLEFTTGIYLETFTNMTSITFGYL